MKNVYLWCLLGLLAGTMAACKPGAKEVAVIKTGAGEMVFDLWPDVAPKTVANFKKLAQQKAAATPAKQNGKKTSKATSAEAEQPASRP